MASYMGGKYWYIYIFAKLEYKNLCEACIRKIAIAHVIEIRVINVMPDHVHVLVTLPKGMTPEKALQLLKGGSAQLIISLDTILKHDSDTIKDIFGAGVVVR